MGQKKQEKKERRKRRKQKESIFLKIVRIWGTLLMLAIIIGGFFFVKKIGIPVFRMYREASRIVDECSESDFRGELTSIIYDADGNEIKKLKGDKDVYYLSYEEIPDAAKLAFISTEDKKFTSHRGIDLMGIARSVVYIALHRGDKGMGGSTITQQLARNVFLGYEKTYSRKLTEIFIAAQLERKFSKEKILEFYLNNVYFANGFYGLEAAAQGYFGKSAKELDISQIAFLASIPNSPNRYDPYEHMDETLARRGRILKSMCDDGYISLEQMQASASEEIKLYTRKDTETNDYVQTYIIRCATESLMVDQGFKLRYIFDSEADKKAYDQEYADLYESCRQSLYYSGYRIHTSIDMKLQKQLQASVSDVLLREGFDQRTDDGVYKLQGAAVCIDNETGRVLAVVGGREANQESFGLNRAYQSFRQPGSAIKPVLVYGPALGKGYTPDSILDDSAMTGENKVRNTDGYEGRITLRRAVAKSSNVATYRLYEELKPKKCLSYLEKMNFRGLDENDYKYNTTCLGGFTKGVTPIEMASAYAALANDGVFRNPDCIVRIEDSQGNTLVSGEEEKKNIYGREAARMMTDVLTTVVESGTAKNCKLDNMPAACKTGTTTSNVDGWLCGYTPYYTTAVWVGKDLYEPQEGLKGNTYPAYIWTDFMNKAHRGLARKEFEKSNQPKDSKDYEEPSTEEKEREDLNPDIQEPDVQVPDLSDDRKEEEDPEVEEEEENYENEGSEDPGNMEDGDGGEEGENGQDQENVDGQDQEEEGIDIQ